MNRQELDYLNKVMRKYEKQLKKEGKAPSQEFNDMHLKILKEISKLNWEGVK